MISIKDVATGQGSVAMEIIKEPFVDYILVPIGGGGSGNRCVHTCQDDESGTSRS